MRVGLLTFCHNNYGAILQAYALLETLSRLECRAELIDYHDPLKGLRNRPLRQKAKHVGWAVVRKLILQDKKRKKRTVAFKHEYLPKGDTSFRDAPSLHASPPHCDAYIVGSDQVWNPLNTHDLAGTYFLSFAPAGAKRISYAASFGIEKLPDACRDNYRKHILGMDSISVRELQGRRIVKELTGRDAELALDPTLLLTPDDWETIAAPDETGEPYVLCYHMPGDRKVTGAINRIAEHIAAKRGWRVIGIGHKEYMRLKPSSSSRFGTGPTEFVRLFKNASYVVTNSFHGAAFSVNFARPFYVPVNDVIHAKKRLSSRIESLLTQLGLEDRLLTIGSPLPDVEESEVDFQAAHLLLNEKRLDSIKFLKHALEIDTRMHAACFPAVDSEDNYR